MKSTTLLTLGLQAATTLAAKVSYDGYKVFHVETTDFEAAQILLSEIEHVSLNCESNHQDLDVAVAPGSLEAFKELGLNATLTTEDLGEELAAEGELGTYESLSISSNEVGIAALPTLTYFNAYHNLDEHNAFLKDLQSGFASNSEVFSAGNSVQGRAIQGIHLWGSGGKGKPAIIWHGNVHAREWITAPTVEYMAYQLVTGYLANDAAITAVLNKYDFFILPIVNPDGFVYTTTTDRLWRKNRQTRSGTSCVGTDVNRNWPNQWSVPGGSSTDPCAETYRGAAAGDATENKALVAHTLSIAKSQGIKFYVDWHAYSQLILLPYGYSCTANIPDLSAQTSVAAGVAAAIKKVNGLDFVYGPTCKTIYAASGGSNDWAYDVAGADYAWAVELRPSSSNSGGFTIPATNILPSGKEVWEGMKYFFTRI